MIFAIRQGLDEDGYVVSISQLCRWFDVPRRSVYYRSNEEGASRAGAFRGADQADDRGKSSFGYRTVAYLLRFNRNTVQRIFQLKHWQVRKR